MCTFVFSSFVRENVTLALVTVFPHMYTFWRMPTFAQIYWKTKRDDVIKP